MASPTLQFKRGAFVNLPVDLRPGEPGFTTDRSDFYIGAADGNKFFGSHRYWTRENGTNAAEFKLVDKDGNSGVSLRAPATTSTPVTYTLPQGGGSVGQYLQLGADGVLAWSSVTEGASLNGATLNGAVFTGISTFNGAIEATSGATFNEIEVTGIATAGSVYIGSDKVLSDELGTLTLSNIEAIDETTRLTLESALSLDPNDFDTLNVTGIGTIGGLFDAKGGLDVTGQTDLDTLAVSGVSTFTGAINANGGVIGNLTGNADTATALQTGRVIELTGDVIGQVVFDGTANVSIAATIQADSVALGSDTTGDYVASVAGTANQITVTGSGGETAAVTISLPDDVVVGTSLSAPTVKASAVQAADGTAAITITSVTGAVGVSSDLTVNGNLNVLGSTTTVNTETLLVKDPLVEVGLVDDNGALVAPSSDSNLDVGMVFHYYDIAARKAAVYWDDSEGRIAIASEVTESNGVLSATAYATLLAGGLEINNACTGGTQEVITCVNDALTLSNVVIDGGEFV